MLLTAKYLLSPGAPHSSTQSLRTALGTWRRRDVVVLGGSRVRRRRGRGGRAYGAPARCSSRTDGDPDGDGSLASHESRVQFTEVGRGDASRVFVRRRDNYVLVYRPNSALVHAVHARV